MRIVFFGPPGAGKGTQAQKLVADYGFPHISTGEMLRAAMLNGSALGRQIAPMMADGRLVPDALVIGIALERLQESDCRQGYMLDGFPRTIPQAEVLDQALSEANRPIEHVVSLEVPDDEIHLRMKGRGRADDQPETVQRRLIQFRTLTAPLKAYYEQRGLLRPINGVGSIDEVYASIKKCIGR